MRTLVTGGAGFIGSTLVRQLIERGHEVTVLDRFFFGRESLAGVKCKIIAADIRDFRDEWLDDIDAVAHLAGLSNDPTADYRPDANREMNVVATEAIVRSCVRRGIQRFTFASSASIYDHEPPKIDGWVHHEGEKVEPRGAYSTSKYEAERIILAATSDTFSPTILRQGTVYGDSPRMRFDLVVNSFVKDAITRQELILHNGGAMSRPLVSVEDCARAHVAVLCSPLQCVAGQIFNIVHENAKIRNVAALVSGLCQCWQAAFVPKVSVSSAGPRIVRDYQMSGEKIREAIGFEANQTIASCVEEMLAKWADFSPQGIENLTDPRHYNIRYMSLLEQVHREQSEFSGIYDTIAKT